MYNILVVDDDKEIVESIEIYLKNEGFNIFKAYNGIEALEILVEKEIHLILMDIMMPKLDGIKATIKIREEKNIPIILVSAKSEDTDKIIGLNIGADDYITKPFGPSEFLARVDALYRRVSSSSANNEKNVNKDELRSGDYVLNLRNRTLTFKGKLVELTYVEFLIMEYFFNNPGVALNRNDILVKVWGDAYFNEEKIVDVNVRRLRMKIEENPSSPKHIITVWGLGYKWEE